MDGRIPVPAVAVSVFRDGQEVYRGAAGLADVEDGIEALPETREALSDFIDDPLIHPPGSATEYTSFGYVLASAVLQAAAGRPYAEVMRETVFAPAGMESIAVEGQPVEGYPVADFYLRKEDDAAFVSTSTLGIDASCKFGGGGFVAGARDLAAFGAALIDGRILSDAALAKMTTVITPAAEDGSYPPIAYPKEGVAVGIISNVNAGGWLILRAHDIARLWWPER